MMAREFPSRADIVYEEIKFYDGYSLDLIQLIYRMLDKNSASRPTITEIQKNGLISVEMIRMLQLQIK